MEKIKIYLKSKSLGYFIIAADAFLAMLISIIFFATYKSAIPNSNLIPAMVGIFALGGMVIEIVALFLPEYKFIHLVSIIMYGISLGKEISLLPKITSNGNLALGVFLVILQIILVGSGIFASFIGFYKNVEEEKTDFKNIKGTKKLVKVITGSALVVASILTTSIVSANLKPKDSNPVTPIPEGDKWNPINEDIKKAAAEKQYDFDPSKVLIKEKEQYDYTNPELTALQFRKTRDGHYMVYCFEGSYAEGYQGDYQERFAYMYLWDDGLYIAKSETTIFRGYWYNSSLRNGHDSSGNNIVDCLNMVSNQQKYESIITQETTGFYERRAYVYLNLGWGERSVIVYGYKYYPEVALSIKTGTSGDKFKVGDKFDKSTWFSYRILKNLKYNVLLKQSDIRWTIPTELNGEVISKAGQYTVKANWSDASLSTSVVVTVTE